MSLTKKTPSHVDAFGVAVMVRGQRQWISIDCSAHRVLRTTSPTRIRLFESEADAIDFLENLSDDRKESLGEFSLAIHRLRLDRGSVARSFQIQKERVSVKLSPKGHPEETFAYRLISIEADS